MNLVEHLSRLFAYDDWANREVLAALQSAKPVPARSVGWLAHIFAAERLWLERLESRRQSLPVWPEFNLERCATQAVELPAMWKVYLAGINEGDLDRSITYKNSKGEPWTSKVEDVLLHVITHSGYHRGQIAADMRGAGFTPAYTDFIHAVRQKLLE